MQKNLLIVVFVAFVSMVWAQSNPQNPPQNQPPAPPTQSSPPVPGTTGTETNPVTQNLSWLIGTWHGSGTQNGQSFESTLNIKPALDGQALLIERDSPSGYKEIMVIAYDKTSQKTVATIFTSQNNSGIFLGNVTPDQATFTQVSSGQGVSERILQKTPDGQLKMIIRGGNAGETPKTLVEMSFTKQS